jgi:hypothetical protein
MHAANMPPPTSAAPASMSLLSLPRELRDDIIGYLVLPHFVYTSSEKPSTANLHRSKVQAKTFVDTRISLPCRVSPNVLGVCQQLREECLQYHHYLLASLPSASNLVQQAEAKPTSNLLAELLGQEVEEEAERLGDHHLRITLEPQRPQKSNFGYAVPVREELSPRFLALLPLMQRVRKLRLIVWPGYEWWDGSRPRAYTKVNGRTSIDENVSAKPDALSCAIGRILDRLPAVEELQIHVLAHVGDLSRWDLPDLLWTNIQYWLDGPVTPEGGHALHKVERKLAAVWNAKLVETIYKQEEEKIDEHGTWHVKRHGDMTTVSSETFSHNDGTFC